MPHTALVSQGSELLLPFDFVVTLAITNQPVTLWNGRDVGYEEQLPLARWAILTAAESNVANIQIGSRLIKSDVAAIGTLTLTGQPLDTETVTLDGKVYTFQTTLTDVDGNVLIGATASDSIDNLIAAITDASGRGTTYAASMTMHTTITAAAAAGDTMIVTALAVGEFGNSRPTTETLTNGSFAETTLKGGSKARGWPFKPGQQEVVGPLDLRTWWVIGTAGDVLRAFYVPMTNPLHTGVPAARRT